MLQAADAIDSSKPAGLAKTAEKHGSSKVRNLNETLLTATVLTNLHAKYLLDWLLLCFLISYNFRWQLLQALRRQQQQTSLLPNGAALR